MCFILLPSLRKINMQQNIASSLVAILRGITPDEIDDHIPLLIAAGFRQIEIPLNSPAWDKSIPYAIKRYGEQATIGAGTVLNCENVNRLADMGCRLIVTPNTNPDVIRQALRRQMQVLPGCATPTEAFSAIDAGAQQIKIFPASLLGTSYVQALKSVLPTNIAVFAVGGVTPDTLPLYVRAGCAGAGLGSDLYRAGQPPALTQQRAQAFIAACQRCIA
jgi:2-dehydro-3-deoxyphosphogalactonate aldolase